MLRDHYSWTEAHFLGKALFGQKQQKMIENDTTFGFYHYFENLFFFFAGNVLKLKIDIVIYLSVQIPYLGKFLLMSYSRKGFQPIRLQDSLITNTSCWIDWITLIFYL